MTTALDGIARLLIDGNNLLHRVSGGVHDGAIRLLLARLTNAMPPPVDTIVMFDGHAAAGTDRRQRVRRGAQAARSWRHGLDAHVAQLTGKAGAAEDHRHARRRMRLGQQHGRRPRGSDDALFGRRQQRHADLLQAGAILVSVRTRVVGHVNDPVAGLGAPVEQRGHARHGIAAAIDDTIEIYKQKHGTMV